MIQSILGSPATGLAKGNTTPISTKLNADPLFNSVTAHDANNTTGANPKAYMTIVFFDERFNYVAENSMALRVSQQGDNAAPLVLANIKAPKNGFAYIPFWCKHIVKLPGARMSGGFCELAILVPV